MLRSSTAHPEPTHSLLPTNMYTCMSTNTSGSRAQIDVLGGSYVRPYRNGAHRSIHPGQSVGARPVTRTRRDARAPWLSKTSKTAPRSQLETPWPGSPSCCRQETRSINFSQQPDSLTQAARPLSPAGPHSDPPPSFQASKFSAPRSSTLTKETRPHGRARACCLFRELRLFSGVLRER